MTDQIKKYIKIKSGKKILNSLKWHKLAYVR